MTLGEVLKRARNQKSMSLRDVERSSRISNGYLSLLESDSVKNPSPNFLYQLASLYDVSYAELMALAGYAVPRAEAAAESEHPVEFMSDLTDDERAQVGTFVRFLRASRKGL
jgi:transcriptional regulator with XRE-family HTH domain